MNTINRTLLAVSIVAGSILSAQLINPSLAGFAAAAVDHSCGCPAGTASCESCVNCSCNECETCVEPATPCTKKRGCGCKGCRKPRKKTNCPNCLSCPNCAVECDTCTLKLDHYEEEKTCFKTEQKIVCIPPVRFPWEECCPPSRSNKTRTVNVLKIHKYKCKSCGYKWELDSLPEPNDSTSSEKSTEPEAPATSQPESAPASEMSTDPATNIDPVVAPVGNESLLTPTDAPRPAFEQPQGSSVPDFDKVPAAPSAAN